MDSFQGGVIDALNKQDAANKDLLEQVVTSAGALSGGKNDVTTAELTTYGTDSLSKTATTATAAKANANADGAIVWGGKAASLQGTGGVALLEYAKDAIQTAVSNISGAGTAQIASRKLVERKIGQLG